MCDIFAKMCHSYFLVINVTGIVQPYTSYVFSFHSLTKSADLLLDSDNWNRAVESQATDIVLAACGMQ